MGLTVALDYVLNGVAVAGVIACVRLLWKLDKNLAVFAERLTTHIESSEKAITKLNGRVYRLERRIGR